MINSALLTELQRGVPLEITPFKSLGLQCGLTEDEVISTIKDAFKTLLARRLGAVYDAASLGYVSTLAAVAVPETDLERVVEKLNALEEVTHNYLRDGTMNVWFTLTAHELLFTSRKKEIEAFCYPYVVYFLPVLEKYKVQVFFDLETGSPLASEKPPPTERLNLTHFEQELIALSQTQMPLESQPFLKWAIALKTTELKVLETFRRFKATGALRRIALIVRHQRAGVDENVMATWRIAPEDSASLGEKLAQCAGVSHCYLRDVPIEIGGNLYAMMHGRDTIDLVEKLQQAQKLFPNIEPQLFKTVRELKKTSPFFFKEALCDG